MTQYDYPERRLLGNLLYYLIKKEDSPMSAHQHLMSAIHTAWCLDGRSLSAFNEEEQEVLREAKETLRILRNQD